MATATLENGSQESVEHEAMLRSAHLLGLETAVDIQDMAGHERSLV
jgi:hypothetical protein